DRKIQQDLVASRDLTLERVIDVMAAAEAAKRDCERGIRVKFIRSRTERLYGVEGTSVGEITDEEGQQRSQTSASVVDPHPTRPRTRNAQRWRKSATIAESLDTSSEGLHA
ncbi:MAG: hypothetical protein GY696_36605, partial [Gammaproteobacteria bacterium]|nr:hypothetical protein [Gammaproteobacteria bacterium]